MKSCEIGNHHDALVYTAGAIKHLSSNNHTVQKELVSLDGIEGLAQILDTISKDVSLPGDLGDFDKKFLGISSVVVSSFLLSPF